MRRCRSSAMLPAIGAASSAIDALQGLFSSKSSSTPSTGFSQGASSPFDFPSSASTATSQSTSTSAGSGTSAFSQISPQTMSALLAAQGQSSISSTTSASASPSDSLKDLFSQIDANG